MSVPVYQADRIVFQSINVRQKVPHCQAKLTIILFFMGEMCILKQTEQFSDVQGPNSQKLGINLSTT